ncbi:0fa193f3-2518-489a-a5b7-15a10a8f43a7 [Thermothielavioides terrestris]|jgi:RNA recognition motif-containing protein|uniref:RRM domain-containing protein n=2 Tax=Thermothielavioides terrestris TaxID=2587410 RepID=G2QSM4_THETT|nr:uncharacterized protein THITE_2108871 [Thermothielavioides terrestris NRRL 8126]AEO63506.1 hypothetical protein THITE_2108871 [Thermothielavioides terrestris NRRL 8126]SPQ21005.1 0fa193f3-2518-489a-a5b7-15a10a8f43a7 [Thermothielavioides terrestris]
MAAKDPEPAAPEEPVATASSKKRKSAHPEIEVDLSLPEPPSKKARRALKKGKTLPAKPASSDDETDGKAAEDGQANGAKDGKKKKKERSPHGVWIGNLPFTTTKAELRKWLVDNSGGSIADDAITRVHMPTTKPAAGAGPKKTPENRGFAYVDFASFDANVAAIALSETELNGRKLLIKDSKNFEGRPKKEEPAVAAANGSGAKAALSGAKAAASGSTKIFVGNLAFNTTEDDLHAHFEKCGKIRWIKVATFEDSGKCKGYGWVNFEQPEAAAWAVKGFVKLRETVETLEDFMDEDPKAADGEGPAQGDDALKADDNDNDDDDSTKTNKPKSSQPQKEPPRTRTRTRKWWVNQLLGRTLKIELAEDDQTRYHKRFGKGAAAAAAARQKKQQKTQQSKHSKAGPSGADGDGDGDGGALTTTSSTTTTPTTTDGKDQKKKKGKESKEISYHTDISVARLTGAAVAPAGKKITFD